MPGFDGTGPMGQGPMTGGGFGYCNPSNAENFANRPYPYFGGRGRAFAGRGFGRGMGRGLGFGRGFRNRFYARGFAPAYTNVPEIDEKQYLQDELKSLEEEINSIKARLKEIGSKDNQ